MTASSDSRNTTRKTGTEKTSGAMAILLELLCLWGEKETLDDEVDELVAKLRKQMADAERTDVRNRGAELGDFFLRKRV